jgi:hypothetical protein
MRTPKKKGLSREVAELMFGLICSKVEKHSIQTYQLEYDMHLQEGKMFLLNKDGLCLDVRLIQLDEEEQEQIFGNK